MHAGTHLVKRLATILHSNSSLIGIFQSKVLGLGGRWLFIGGTNDPIDIFCPQVETAGRTIGTGGSNVT
jgi:hypothetical protein